ncbi:YueH family protein [Staphylococcus sp. Marseille-Q5304]|uniref:YueH family protein n=1 Tax=Staphylococcus sp. Marseille-Q5304 TaxID=2942200 RepID=UPI00203CC8BB|nr:YueH family protein [Staphylococcus sp. Marseille-Q5304]
MIIKSLSINDIASNVYIALNNENDMYLIAIPELNWSLEVDKSLSDDDFKDELVIHLFTLLDESLSNDIANAIIQWIFED